MLIDDYNKKLEEERIKIKNDLKDLDSDLAIDYLTLEQAALQKFDREKELNNKIDELINKLSIITRFYGNNWHDISDKEVKYKSLLAEQMEDISYLKSLTVEDYYAIIKSKRTKNAYYVDYTVNEKNINEINRLISENPEYLSKLIEDIADCCKCFKYFKYMGEIGKTYGEKYNLRYFTYFGLKVGMNSFDITKKKIRDVRNEKLLSYYNPLVISKFLSVYDKKWQLDLEGYKNVLALARLFDLDKGVIQNLNNIINMKENESFIQKLFSKNGPFARDIINDVKNKILTEYSQPYLADQELYKLFVAAINSYDKDSDDNNIKLLRELNNFECDLKRLLNELSYRIVALEQYENDLVNPMIDEVNSNYSYLSNPVEFFKKFKSDNKNEILNTLAKMTGSIEKKNFINKKTEEAKSNSELESAEIREKFQNDPILTESFSKQKLKRY